MGVIELQTDDDPRLAVFSAMTDAELRDPKQLIGLARSIDSAADPHCLANGLFIAESRNVISRALDGGCKPFAFLVEERWRAEALAVAAPLLHQDPSLPVFVGDRDIVGRITGYRGTRGPMAAFHRPPLRSPESVIGEARRVAVLEDVTNYTNIGAIFRSAAALGIDAVLLTPRCHDPLYRRASRVAMGTVFQVPWARLEGTWPCDGIEMLHRCGFSVVALALSDTATELQDDKLKRLDKIALVLGTEGDGLSETTVASCDAVVRIPMDHDVDSLNVAAASAVAFWEFRTKHR